jgi:hypothetical protein
MEIKELMELCVLSTLYAAVKGRKIPIQHMRLRKNALQQGHLVRLRFDSISLLKVFGQ